jgi:plasmid stabilization system protein ParE
MSRYVLSEQAERDLNEIWDYIADQKEDTGTQSISIGLRPRFTIPPARTATPFLLPYPV